MARKPRCKVATAKNDHGEKMDPLDQRNWANLEWIDRDNIRDDPGYQPEIVFDLTSPEDLHASIPIIGTALLSCFWQSSQKESPKVAH